VALRVDRLSQRYGKIEALSDVTFDIRELEIFGLLGPNGAGKTTLISILATYRRPSRGDVFLFGRSMRKRRSALRRMMGVGPEDIALYPMLTAAENLYFFGRIFGLAGSELKSRVEEFLQDIGLEARANDHVSTFSNGMKRRLNLALAVMHRPKLILLDEPTAGIDPRSRDQILNVVRGLRDKGSAILYTTHYIDEVETLCDRVGILNHGKLIALGAIDRLLGELDFSEIVEVRGLAKPVDLGAIRTMEGVSRVERGDGVVRLFVKSAADLLEPLQRVAGHSGPDVRVKVAPLSLHYLFLHLTGEEQSATGT
jgi:ABC-2 type transport system ATP-binding protein